MTEGKSQFILPNDNPVVTLDCEAAFSGLTKKEKFYAHYFSQASWYGGLVVLFQSSPESPLIFCLLHKVFNAETIEKLQAKSWLSVEEFKAFLVYTCGIFANMGNYKGFGDTKFVPNLPQDKFYKVIKASKAYADDPKTMEYLWDNCKDDMYSLDSSKKSLGFPNKGTTTYFSSNCTEEDSDIVTSFLKECKLEGYNSRTFKSIVNGKTHFEIRVASSEDGFDGSFMFEEKTHRNCIFKMTRNDYGPLLKLVIDNLTKAKKYAANAKQEQMIEKYIESFVTGNLDAHKDGSRHWIADKGPIIETYIGFIETYRDPAGMRAEFEGFVAMVNRDMSAKFSNLVEKASSLITRLPWGKDFEKDKFFQPDFTSLDVLTFAGSDIPSGINIPNYDEIRQDEGFKNVSLGNVIPASHKTSLFYFLRPEDQELMLKYSVPSFEVQVGLHELLGHGTGKLFKKNADGTFNFDKDTIDPVSNEKISSWFDDGETYDGVFAELSSPYEECRAECVGLYLCLHRDILEIFGHRGSVADDIMYVNWLNLLWAGTSKALEFYNPETKCWLQAHSQARFVISNVLIEAGEGLVVVEDKGDELLVKLDRSKLETVGKKAIGDFLLKLQVYKSTRNISAARELFAKYSSVTDKKPYPWATWRNIILSHRQPRRMFIQGNTYIKDEDVFLKSYQPSVEELITSWMHRFPCEDIYPIITELWKKDSHHFSKNN